MATAAAMALPLPPQFAYDPAGPSDPQDSPIQHKFPHTRAQLSAIARQYRPQSDSYDSDAEADDYSRVSSSFVNRVVALLDDEHEDELKDVLKGMYGMDDEALEQNVLDLMHKHRDDIAGVPFLFLTATRRPISRPSSRASTNSLRLYPARPDTPTLSAPSSPLAMVFRRPHTPATSPLGTGGGSGSSYMTARNESAYSPQSSPVLPHVFPQFTASLPATPLSSPRLLNAKASEFKPIPRPLSAASCNPGSLLRAETPSPDMWSHSPLRTSNLAIAAPLIPERALTPSSSLRSSLRPDEDNEDDGDEDDPDPFDPFSKALPLSFHSLSLSEFDAAQWSNSSNSSRSPESMDALPPPSHFGGSYGSIPESENALGLSPDPDDKDIESMQLTEGMTPFDVLSSVFGSTLAPSELEEALAANGYDFERAIAWLVDRTPPAPQAAPSPRVTLVGRNMAGPNVAGRGAPRYNGRPVQGGNRVCRYFVAGECLRADCRFSHDLERALCRFWLRGTCAKQENCEFLHHLPKDVDIQSLNVALARANVPPGTGPLAAHTMNMLNVAPPPDDFPVLGFDGGNGAKGRRGGGYASPYDPGRVRFAAAVKKSIPPTANTDANLSARREVMGHSADNLHHRSAIIAPRPSPRLKLRPPSLLPTLPTGESVSSLYMAYRQRALQLGAARNACLSRAADAWRRGDGAAAKRFSREGHELNGKMAAEMADAAGRLVRERAKMAEGAVRTRETSWSDDPGDRAARGRPCGAGFGVCLGVASSAIAAGTTSDERTESVLDLHGLHAGEATEVLEDFLLALEQEHFYGLAYIVVGEEKHTGTQDAARGTSRARLATGVREWVHRWGYPWSERDGIICVDPLTHASE